MQEVLEQLVNRAASPAALSAGQLPAQSSGPFTRRQRNLSQRQVQYRYRYLNALPYRYAAWLHARKET